MNHLMCPDWLPPPSSSSPTPSFTPLFNTQAAAERDLLRVLHSHRQGKAAYSGRFPGCDAPTVCVRRDALCPVTRHPPVPLVA